MSEERVDYSVGNNSSYVKLQVKELFYKLHYRSFPLVKKLGPTFITYLYMIENITRRRGRYKWWNENILPYYHKGHLPFAKHQSFMAKDLSLTQSRISQQLKMLSDIGIIKKIDVLDFTPKRKIDVYSLGTWTDEGNERVQTYFLAEITFEE